MSVESFQAFLASDERLSSFGTCHKTVDLLAPPTSPAAKAEEGTDNKAAAVAKGPRPRTALVADTEGCLDRLYGGYYSDWSCGGQWGHAVDFLATLVGTLHRSNVQLAFFFHGALEAERFEEWRESQLELKERAAKVLKHIHKRATPPPKAFWVPPTAIRSVLRLALKTLNCTVVR